MKTLFLTIILGLSNADWTVDGDNEISKAIKDEAKKLEEKDELEKLSTLSKWI